MDSRSELNHLHIHRIDLVDVEYYRMSKWLPWVEFTNHRIDEINELIQQYNYALSTSERIDALKEIDTAQQSLSDALPDAVYDLLDNFRRQVSTSLFDEMKTQRANLEVARDYQPKTCDSEMITLADFINDMEYSRLIKMLRILKDGSRAILTDLSALYELSHPLFPAFQLCLSRCEIRYLNGSNSLNFLVRDKSTNECTVLKVENNMDTTKVVERSLRHQLSGYSDEDNFLVKVYAERRVSLDEDHMVRTIEITDFIHDKTIQEIANEELSMTKRGNLSIEIGLAQLELSHKTSMLGAVNTDYKSSNIYIRQNEDGSFSAMVSDTKAYYTFDKDKHIIPAWDNQVIASDFRSAPELRTMRKIPCDVDAIHAYSVAKNMYHVLFGSNPQLILDSRTTKGVAESDFKHSYLKTPQGLALKEFILSIGNASPEFRLSIDDAMKRLKNIKLGVHQQEARAALKQLRAGDNTDLYDASVRCDIYTQRT